MKNVQVFRINQRYFVLKQFLWHYYQDPHRNHRPIHQSHPQRLAFMHLCKSDWASQVALMGKNPPGFDPWVRKILWRRVQQPTLFSPEEALDREAWRATVHRAAKSQIQLKRLSMQTRIRVLW